MQDIKVAAIVGEYCSRRQNTFTVATLDRQIGMVGRAKI